jgi:hypothetical protein
MSNRHQRRADLRCFRHQVHRDHIVTHMVDASADLSAFPSNGNRDPSAKARKRWSAAVAAARRNSTRCPTASATASRQPPTRRRRRSDTQDQPPTRAAFAHFRCVAGGTGARPGLRKVGLVFQFLSRPWPAPDVAAPAHPRRSDRRV